MSVLGDINTRNYSQKTNYQCGSSEMNLLPFYATEVSLPGISTNVIETSGRAGAAINMSPADMVYNPLSVTVLLDEDYKVWQDIMNSIHIDVKNGTFKNQYFDFWIEVFNDMGKSVMKVEYHSCTIESISDLELSTSDDTTEQTFTIDIKYDWFEIIKNDVPTLRV